MNEKKNERWSGKAKTVMRYSMYVAIEQANIQLKTSFCSLFEIRLKVAGINTD